MSMKAIILYQPWASLIAMGEKRIETRSWKRDSLLGSAIAIHAGLRFAPEHRALCRTDPFRAALVRHGLDEASLPLGAVVAIARIANFRPTLEIVTGMDADERAFGDYGPGRWGWALVEVGPVTPPIRARGWQGVWEWRDGPSALGGHAP